MFRSRAGIALLAVACVVCLVACGGKKGNAIAELKKADGAIERQQGEGAWAAVKVGQLYYIGDAARTADAPAELQITGGGATITMQPHTVLRFGGKEGNSKIAVELGAIDLLGNGLVGLDVGDVRLKSGRVRVTAKGEGATLSLEMGDASVSNLKGETFEMVIGSIVDLNPDDVTVTSVPDAAVADAAIDAPENATAPDVATLVADGKKVELQNPGEKKWNTVEGQVVLTPGMRVRVGKGSSAKVTAKGVALDMGGGSSMTLGEGLSIAVDGGATHGRVDAGGRGNVKLPGGAIELRGGQQAGADAKLDVSPRDTKVAIARGNAELIGVTGGKLEMNRGESATLAKNGTIRVVEAIPNYYDFQVAVGESATIHDPRGKTAVQFQFGGKCKDGGFIEMDSNARFQTAKVSGGKDSANLMADVGQWAYRLRCSSGGGDSAPVASGRVRVMKDDGSRPLPKQAATVPIDADGRTWRISYQSVIPLVQVSTKGTGSDFKLHIATGGKEQVFPGKGAKISVPGNKLDEGTYTYYLERDGVNDPKVSTLIIDFDNTAPQVYIQSPPPISAKPWEAQVRIRGALMPGWTAAAGGVEIPVDKQRRFVGTVDKPTGTTTLSIRLSHPQRGVHYYLRRGK
ncbi:MAG: hypothetical protein ACKV2T_33420 [Kofleriaceae bacterium]